MLKRFKGKSAFLKDESGGGTIEACLWLPVLIGFFILIFDATYVFLKDGEIRRVLQEGNRQYVKGLHSNDPTELETWIETTLAQLAPNANATSSLDSTTGILTTSVTYPASDTDITGWVSALTGLVITVSCRQSNGGLTMTIQTKRNFALRFLKDARGGITIWSLFNFLLILGFAGLALDVNNAVRSRTQLQGAADAAGHAALLARYETGDEDVGRTTGVAVAAANMPTSIFGNVLATADIEFGNWERTTRTFTPGSGSSAVRVTTRRIDSRGNSLSTFLLDVLGISSMELNTSSVWDFEDGICVTNDADGIPGEGFFALGVVDMQTDNTFGEGFCIHSETYVKLSTHNTFLDDVYVSMPDLGDLQMPTSGWENNDGIDEALHQGSYPMLHAFFSTPNGKFYQMVDSYDDADLANPQVYEVIDVNLPGSAKLTQAIVDDALATAASTLEPLLRIRCAGQSFSVAQDETISGVKMVTDCRVSFLQGSAIENVTLVTTNTDHHSISGPNGTRWGNPTYCGDTSVGGVHVLTKGGIQMAADFEGHGLEILAAGDVDLAAKADGVTSINIVSGR